MGVDDYRPGIPVPGERSRVVVIGVDRCLHRIAAAYGEVTANVRLKTSQTTDRGERSKAVLYNVSHAVAIVVFVIRIAYLLGGEDASELEETINRIIELGRPIFTRIHQVDELAGVDLRAWDINS